MALHGKARRDADEQLGDDGEALRVIYGPTFRAIVAVTLRKVGALAEIEVLVDGVAPERAMLTAEQCAPPWSGPVSKALVDIRGYLDEVAEARSAQPRRYR